MNRVVKQMFAVLMVVGAVSGMVLAGTEKLTQPLIEIILVKGEEELAMLRHAAQIGEIACEAMIEVTRPGVSEGEIYSTILQEIGKNGAD